MTMSIPTSITPLLSWNLDDLQAAKISSLHADHGKKKARHVWNGNVASWFVTVGQSMELRFRHLPHNSRLSASLLPPQRVQYIYFSSRIPSYGWPSSVMLCILISFFFHPYICCCNLHFTLANFNNYLAFYNIWQGSQSTEIQLMHLKKSVFSKWRIKKFPLWGSSTADKITHFIPQILLKLT